METLESFLSRYPSFGGWTEKWRGVALEFRAGLSDELPPRWLVGSVRAIVLRDQAVLVVRSPVPMLSVGGRPEPGETLEQALRREVAEETGWTVSPLGVIGFIHVRHLDDQRPDWGRPAPDFIDLLFAATATGLAPNPSELPCEFVPLNEVEQVGIHPIERTLLTAALRKRPG